MEAMNRDAQRVDRMAELPEETRQFLSGLSKEDVKTLKTGLPILRAVLGFAKVTKWLIVGLLGVFGGIVMFGESIIKIMAWFKPPIPPA